MYRKIFHHQAEFCYLLRIILRLQTREIILVSANIYFSRNIDETIIRNYNINVIDRCIDSIFIFIGFKVVQVALSFWEELGWIASSLVGGIFLEKGLEISKHVFAVCCLFHEFISSRSKLKNAINMIGSTSWDLGNAFA